MLRALVRAVAFVLWSAGTLWAQDLATPEGDVILTVSGQISKTNVDDSAQFDLAMLEALDGSVIKTSTIWTDKVHAFQGVALDVLVEHLGVKGTVLRASAVNDYTVDIPISDAVVNGPILAYRMDEQTMSLREKGPLWIIYPYDSSAQYRTEVIYSRSIWQLERIEAVE